MVNTHLGEKTKTSTWRTSESQGIIVSLSQASFVTEATCLSVSKEKIQGGDGNEGKMRIREVIREYSEEGRRG